MDEDQAVRVAVSKHTSTPPETLEVMASELDRRRDLAIARALASNPHTPIRTLEDLLQSGTGGWRTLAGAALRERAEVAAGAVLDGAERAGMAIDATRIAAADDLDDVLGAILTAKTAKVA